jgi:type VI secretion system protein ImpM
MNTLAPGCFGKLPIFSDFIRYNASGEEIDQMDQWIQKGIQLSRIRLGQAWQKDFENSRPWNFLYFTENSKGFLLGVSVPGRDQSGRQFPFLLFVRIEKTAFKLPLSYAPMVFSGFLARAGEIAQRGWQGNEMNRYIEKVASIPTALDLEIEKAEDHLINFLKARKTGELWEALFGEAERSKKYLLERNLTEILQPLGGSPVQKLTLGLKFPLLSSDDESLNLLPFWVDLIFRKVKGKRGDPLLFWSGGIENRKPCMMTFFNPPTPKQFLFMVRPDLDDDTWFDLAPEETLLSDPAIEALSRERKEALDRKETSLLEFLTAAGGQNES